VLDDFISLKFLPQGMVTDFKDSIEPFYYSEVMGTPEFKNVYGEMETDEFGNMKMAEA
jgi:hypothetical protein